MILVADACALICFLTADRRMRERVRAQLDDETNTIVIPAIALFEMAFTFRKGRHKANPEAALALLISRARSMLFPLGPELLPLMPLELEIHDALYVATARLLAARHPEADVALVTSDSAIAGAYERVGW